MNWIDLVLAIVILVSVLTGFTAGFARVGVGFIAMLVGLFCGFWFYGLVGVYVQDYVSSRTMANLIGFFVIFFGLLIVGAIIGMILAKLFKWVGLSWFDRLLGGAFGLVRGLVIAAGLVTVLLAFAPTPPPGSVVNSRFMPYMVNVSELFAALTPHEIKDAFYTAKDKVKSEWDQRPLGRKPDNLRHE